MRSILAAIALMLGLAGGTPAASAQTADQGVFDGRPGPRLRHFASDSAFARYVRPFRRPLRRGQQPESIEDSQDIIVTAARAPSPSGTDNPEITNNQTRGVDEGGIVKQIGHFLIVLQDGRLFSVDLGSRPGAAMRLAGRIDVYRDEGSAADWYDEMLVYGDRILVTAYSYKDKASEITVARMKPDGSLKREARYLLSSEDYYSTENYASRLVGDSLVFYAPFDLYGEGPFKMPRLRRARGDGPADRGEETLSGVDIYAPAGEVSDPLLHTVSICPLAEGIECRTTGFVGPGMREFFVSPDDVFLWVGSPEELPWEIDYGNLERIDCPTGQELREGEDNAALLYRLPIDAGRRVGAVAVDGIPADQFSFDSREGRFRALLGQTQQGCLGPDDAWPLALLDIPLSAFGPVIRHVAPRAYTPMPPIEGGQLENRFMGDWLVYGGRSNWGSFDPDTDKALKSSLFAVPLRDPKGVTRLSLPHNAIRIERAGSDALVTGYRDTGGMSLSYISLLGTPRITSTLVLARRFETESRSHAFGATMRADGSGLIGIPTSVRSWRADRGWSDSESSDLSFIAIGRDKSLTSAGELGVPRRPEESSDDDPDAYRYECSVSCIDWYGNSRPIFTSGRIFALMGTDLVEGEMRDGRMVAIGRVDMTARLTQ